MRKIPIGAIRLGLAISLLSALVAAATSLDEVTITFQGVLTDSQGQPLANGFHVVNWELRQQDSTLIATGTDSVETFGGMFTLHLDSLDIGLFECQDTTHPCLQTCVITLVGENVTFPSIQITQTGRAAVAARVNGDINTSPSMISIPSSVAFAPQKTSTIFDSGLVIKDHNGNAAFRVSTATYPGKFEVYPFMNSTLGPTAVQGTFEVNPFSDYPRLQLGLDGVFRLRSIYNLDGNNDGNQEFGTSVEGSLYFDGDGPGSGFGFWNANGFDLNVPRLRLDRDFDFQNDVNFDSDGGFRLNADMNGADEFVFNSSWAQFRKPFGINLDGLGFAEFEVASGGNVFADPDGDGQDELKVDANGVQTTALITNSLQVKTDSAVMFHSGAAQFWVDADVDGENELGLEEVDGHLILTLNGLGVRGDSAWKMLANNDVFRVDVNGDNQSEFKIHDFGQGLVSAFFDTEIQIDIPNAGGNIDMLFFEEANVPKLKIFGDLEVTGNKQFVQTHPTDPAKEIAYVALEGGEAGTYTRGTAKLLSGVAVIDLPEHFALVTAENGITTQITPRAPVKSMLYVEGVSRSRLVVKASNPSDADVPFDYTVNGLRAGYENHQPVRDKQNVVSLK